MADSKKRLKTLAELRELQDALDKDIRAVEATTVEHTEQIRAGDSAGRIGLKNEIERAENAVDAMFKQHFGAMQDIITARMNYVENTYQKKPGVFGWVAILVGLVSGNIIVSALLDLL